MNKKTTAKDKQRRKGLRAQKKGYCDNLEKKEAIGIYKAGGY